MGEGANASFNSPPLLEGTEVSPLQMRNLMFYRKHPRGWERVLRAIAGDALIALSLLAFPATPLGCAIATGGIVSALIGSCPMCAMIGRKLPS
jgi:hypothetical protein